jgi:hypothetical protein
LGVGGLWSQSKPEFAAVKFPVSKNSKGAINYDYGWVQLEWQDPKKIGFPTTLIAIDWAYNNVANRHIIAGEGLPPPILIENPPSAVPEPSTLALALLAAGAAGVLAWRRGRQAGVSGEQQDTPAGTLQNF